MSDRTEAAAKAIAKDEDASNWHDEPEYYRNGWLGRVKTILAAADAVMFSDEAVERAAKAIHDLGNVKPWDKRDERLKDLYREDVRAVIAALKETE